MFQEEEGTISLQYSFGTLLATSSNFKKLSLKRKLKLSLIFKASTLPGNITSKLRNVQRGGLRAATGQQAGLKDSLDSQSQNSSLLPQFSLCNPWLPRAEETRKTCIHPYSFLSWE